jgi:hypothetical protein
MMLGAINPINVNVIKDRITTTQSDPSKIQTFAAQTNQVIDPSKIQTFATNTNQVVDPSKGLSPLVQPPTSEGTDYMAMIKKYAPYAIGAILLYYVISKK